MIYDFLYSLIGDSSVSSFLNSIVPLLFIIPFALFAVYLERKVSAYMQDRIGPNRCGPGGWFQTTADILKLLQKEDIVARDTDKPLFNIAPVLVFIGSYSAFAAIPFSSIYIGTNIELGLLYVVSVSGFVVAGLLMAGWASNNKYSLFGAMRSASQMISYEIPTVLVIISALIISGTLNLFTLTEYQTSNVFNWLIFGGTAESWKKFALIPFTFIGFLIIYISTLAEVNRTPFDIPEAESELVSGYHTEYSGMKFAMFFLAEYANMFAVSIIIVSIFFGGYHSPFGYLGNSLGITWLVPLEQFFWFTVKGIFLVFVQMWLRWTLPRLRVDQLMIMCWKYLIPISLVNLLIIAFIMVI